MQATNLPVLILAQSGRFLAQSATQAGFTVWVADCFGDLDTLDVAERWLQIPALSELTPLIFSQILTRITQDQSCLLVAGSGVELYYPLLNKLPDNIQLLGNSFHTIKNIKTPHLFFNLLDLLKIAYPHTQFEQPYNHKGYLLKSSSGSGGNHIQHLDNAVDTQQCYFQRFVIGQSGSILILANGEDAQIISINQQFLAPSNDSPFRLGNIETPWEISKEHKQQLEQSANKITSKAGLLGLNSIDFIISEDNVLQLLEVNPRPSASAELVDKRIPLFQLHINACQGRLPSVFLETASIKRALHTIYADNDCLIPDDIVWYKECSDLPFPGSTIKKGQPICTIITEKDRAIHIKQRLTRQLNRL